MLEKVRGNDTFWKNNVISAGVEDSVLDGYDVSGEICGEVGAPRRAVTGKGELRGRKARIRIALI